MNPAAAKRSLVDIALESLGQQLSTGRWPVGCRIPTEPELAEELGISRNTVREAIRVLLYAGLLEVRQGDGTYVRAVVNPGAAMRAISRASLREHLEVRCLLEESAARLAAERAADDDVARIAAALDGLAPREGETTEDYARRDLVFHLSIADACGNQALAGLYRYFSDAVRQSVQDSIRDEALPDPGYEAHAAIFESIRQRQPDAAGQAAAAITRPLLAALDRLLDKQQ
ncbi:FadR family transcriptional regulator [Chromobacterium phragmitis]|uniref:FCD domain-containing protein n=1 Tax=Chromobacterium phragmitis TaxID=2202141 RepID=A0A344UGR3_9NEIS|nr:FCD domain-containing protein [Chromobacterium phragmitis]AXE29101.1 FadR family transcriptional regulator [Chromobacterium phragmitis]AXE34461.1 FadR family transcriptional regulator [Chromobacterium phragmitis]